MVCMTSKLRHGNATTNARERRGDSGSDNESAYGVHNRRMNRGALSRLVPAFLTALLAVLACRRYELVSPECRPVEPVRSHGSWRGSTSSARVEGWVLDLATSRPRPHAVVGVPALRRQTRSDSTGYFRLDSVPPGRYEIVTRDLGYRSYRDTVSVSAGGGTVGRVWLDAATMTFDECGYVQIQRRKPWWKWW